MAVLRELKKALQRGRQKNSSGTHRVDRAIARVGSFLKKERSPRYVVKIPKGRTFGKVLYSVRAVTDTKTFTKLKDARDYQRLLRSSTAEMQSEIIRREITDEGYTISEEKRK